MEKQRLTFNRKVLIFQTSLTLCFTQLTPLVKVSTDPTENDEERKLTVQWPLWSEPKLIVLGTDLWLTSSSLLFWAFETSSKVLLANSSTSSSVCTWCFFRSSFATNPHKEWSCISQFSLLCHLLIAATCHWDKSREKNWQPHSLCVQTRNITLVGCFGFFFFLQGHGIEKQCGLSGISGAFVP